MMQKIKQLFAWLQKNERHISTLVFVGGTTTDILTLTKVSISYAVMLLGIYTVVAIVATIVEHYLYIHEAEEKQFLRNLRLALAFLAEFMIGCLLSGILVFYTRSAALNVSWPFILLLVIILFGNEFLRNYKELLAFRVTLIFFTLYAYTVFTLPTLLHHIGPDTFLESSAVTTGAFLVFIILLAFAGWKRLKVSLFEIVVGVCAVLLVVNTSYFVGIIPPLPLALRDVGVYHSITYTTDTTGAGSYQVQTEKAVKIPWWNFGYIAPVTVHVVPGESLSVFSAIFAPTSFSTAVMHKWDWYNPTAKAWQTKAQIAFGISGGRDDGYRGYSTLSGIEPGKYRVSIETLSGQVIGRLYFNVESTTTEPVLQTETH